MVLVVVAVAECLCCCGLRCLYVYLLLSLLISCGWCCGGCRGECCGGCCVVVVDVLMLFRNALLCDACLHVSVFYVWQMSVAMNR